MIIADTTQLTSQEITMLALVLLTLIFIVIMIIYRVATGHTRDDFMTPGEVRRTYFPSSEEAQQDAEYTPTEEERHTNRKTWLVFFVGCAIIGVIYLASGR